MPSRKSFKPLSGAALRNLRKQLGLNQIEFWERVKVTQSGGSRYEGGREMPPAVAELVDIVYRGKAPDVYQS